MSRNYWKVYIQDSASLWVEDSLLPIPNENLAMNTVGNIQKVILMDGSKALISPTTTTLLDTLSFEWNYVDDSVESLINYYMTTGELVKIETHMASKVWVGKFLTVTNIDNVGVDDTETGEFGGFTTIATFEPMRNDGV